MTRDSSLLKDLGREELVRRQVTALEQRWNRPFTLPMASDAVRHDTGGANGVESVQLRDRADQWVRVHSARDPLREAHRWLDEALNGRPLPSAVCIVGGGLGFVLDAIEARSSSTRILVLEPEPAMVPLMLGRRDFSALIRARRLLILWGPDYDGATEAWRVIDGEPDPLILSHPVITRARPEATTGAARVLHRATNDWKQNHDARMRFAGRYLVNTLRNLPLFDRAGDFASLAGAYAGTPAIIVGAGPMLNQNLDELRTLKDFRDRAVIISTDTALRPCLAAGVEPHFVVGVDPAEVNARHLSNLPPCEETWLLAEPSLDARAFTEFADRTLLFRIAAHDPWPWLQARGRDRGLVRVWGSVLTASLDISLQLGCDPLIMVGSDLAYTNHQPYCRGTAYEEDWAAQVAVGRTLDDVWDSWLREPGFEADDIGDVPIRTTSYFVAFRDWLVDLSTRERTRRFINATGAGILVGGAFTQATLTDTFAKLPHSTRPARRPQVPTPPASPPQIEPFEQWLATDPAATLTWSPSKLSDEAQRAPIEQIDASVDATHRQRLEEAERPAPAAAPAQNVQAQTTQASNMQAPSVQAEIDDLHARLAAVTFADGPLTTALVDWLRGQHWRDWPLAERVRLLRTIGQTYMRNRSTLIPRIYPGLVDLFRSTLTTDLHVGFACQLYDLLYTLQWMVAQDPGDLVSARSDIADPLSQHARQWQTRLQLPARTTIGAPPYRVAYLGRTSNLGVTNAPGRITLSLLRGHARLASPRFRFYYYAWHGINDDFQRALDQIGVTVRVCHQSVSPCASLARLRGALAADRIDVLVTDGSMSVPTAMFASRGAPIQIFNDLGFSPWLRDTVDYTLLGFAGDPDALDLAPARYEHLDHHFDPEFVFSEVPAEEIAAERARFGRASHVFGFVGRLVKLSPDYLRAIATILDRLPDAAMYIGGVGDDEALRRELAGLGDVASRIVVESKMVNGAAVMRAIDTFLDTFPFFGRLSCLQAQAAGRPVIYRADTRPGPRQFLSLARDPILQAGSLPEYVDLAQRLATSTDTWQARSREAERVANRATDVVASATQVEDALDRLIQQHAGRVD